MLTKQVQLLRERLKATPLGNTVAAFLDYLTVEAGLSENTLLAYDGVSLHAAPVQARTRRKQHQPQPGRNQDAAAVRYIDRPGVRGHH